MSPETTMASLASRFLASRVWFPSMAPSFPFFLLPNTFLFISLSVFFPTVFQEPISLRIILTLSHYNRSWTQNLASVWLDELQTHGWNNKAGAFIFLWPWSKGNLSNEEVIIAEESFYSNFIGIPYCYRDLLSEWQLECEFYSLRGGMEVAVYVSP